MRVSDRHDGGVPEIRAVCRVNRLRPDPGAVGITAIDKTPVDGAVRVRDLGLYADVQADRANHGGEAKALYAYAQEDADWWGERLGRDIVPGLFGENLRTSGIDLGGALIGERWRIGAALEVEVTMPRTPCATFQRHLDEPQWVKRFAEAGRTGTYLRVLRRGSVQAGDEIAVLSRPHHKVSIAGWFTRRLRADAEALYVAERSGELRIAADLREYLDRALA
ncbi:MOSC domain-containing protein [Microbacteriaceae bacterium VKM Ac-2855]|nr:MOSC domain-containing protein [Microbacteriaceae bacterium VKM Ac-2855]